MPLHEGAKPGSEGFKENIEAEMEAGKPQKQALAMPIQRRVSAIIVRLSSRSIMSGMR